MTLQFSQVIVITIVKEKRKIKINNKKYLKTG